MSEAEAANKLRLKAGMKALVLNAPEGYNIPGTEAMTRPDGLPQGSVDFILAYGKTIKEVEVSVPGIKKAIKPDGLLWIAYLKGGAKAGTDLNRDILRAALEKHALIGVSLVAIDDKWAAMRFRPAEKVGK